MKVLEFIIKLFGIIILLGSFVYLFGLAGIINHEKIHQRIFWDYGFDSTFEIDYNILKGVTTSIGEGDCNDFCLIQHRFNDIVFFNTILLFFTLWAIFIVYFISKLLFKRK